MRVHLHDAPIEIGFSEGQIAALSFVYNHFAMGLMAALAIFALFPSQDGRAEIGGPILCGPMLYVLMLTKPTLVVFVPFFLLALLVQARWPEGGVRELIRHTIFLGIEQTLALTVAVIYLCFGY